MREGGSKLTGRLKSPARERNVREEGRELINWLNCEDFSKTRVVREEGRELIG